MKEAVAIISNVGFPITCVIFLWSFYITRFIKLEKDIQEIKDRLREKA